MVGRERVQGTDASGAGTALGKEQTTEPLLASVSGKASWWCSCTKDMLLSLPLSSGPGTPWGQLGARRPRPPLQCLSLALSCQGGVSSCPAGPLRPT